MPSLDSRISSSRFSKPWQRLASHQHGSDSQKKRNSRMHSEGNCHESKSWCTYDHRIFYKMMRKFVTAEFDSICWRNEFDAIMKRGNPRKKIFEFQFSVTNCTILGCGIKFVHLMQFLLTAWSAVYINACPKCNFASFSRLSIEKLTISRLESIL